MTAASAPDELELVMPPEHVVLLELVVLLLLPVLVEVVPLELVVPLEPLVELALLVLELELVVVLPDDVVPLELAPLDVDPELDALCVEVAPPAPPRPSVYSWNETAQPPVALIPIASASARFRGVVVTLVTSSPPAASSHHRA
jgi:hypothetical protein